MSKRNLWGEIAGKVRKRTHILSGIETKVINFLCPLVPKFIQTYHLTWSSLVTIAGIIVFSFLARDNILWLWGTNAMIVLHFITDALDGEIGRRRNTGLIKWGFHVDHFLDFLFSTAIILGYFLLFGQRPLVFMTLIILLGGFFVDNLLQTIALNKYQTSGFFGVGPTETYVFLVIFNLCLIFFKNFPAIEVIICVCVFFFIILTFSFLKTQKKLWEIDMKNKRKAKS